MSASSTGGMRGFRQRGLDERRQFAFLLRLPRAVAALLDPGLLVAHQILAQLVGGADAAATGQRLADPGVLTRMTPSPRFFARLMNERLVLRSGR
jgi:hypothetical protein